MQHWECHFCEVFICKSYHRSSGMFSFSYHDICSAYRFPTDDCPGYYGFAFPSGLNRTEAQKAQKPRTTPSDASRCLNFQAPTSTPTPVAADTFRGLKISQSTYKVYMNEEDGQVSLVGWDELPKEVWNLTGTRSD